MSKHTKNVVVVAFHAPLTSGCDYATQTITLLSKRHIVFGFLLGEPISWRDIFSLTKTKRIIVHYKNVILFRPFFIVPGQRFFVIKLVNIVINAMVLKSYIWFQYRQSHKYLWFFEPFCVSQLLDVFSSYESIFDCVDYFFTVQPPFLSQLKEALNRATHVFVNSITLKNQMIQYRNNLMVVPLGFAHRLFDKYPNNKIMSTSQTKIVGFIGGIDDRLNYHLLYNTARSLRKMEFVFVGKNYLTYKSTPTYFHSFRSLPNVKLVGEIDKRAIPKIIQSFDICLIPYDVKQPFNRYCFPMKTLEYFYYGKPVFTTDVVELRRFQKELFIVSSHNELVKKIQGVIKNGLSKKTRKAQRSVALQNSWEAKVEAISAVVFV